MFFSLRSVSLLALVGLAASASALEVRDASALTSVPEAAEVFAKHLMAQAAASGKVEGRALAQRPKARRDSAGACSVGQPQCCNQIVNDQAQKDVFAALAGISQLTGPLALDCFQLPINAIGGALAAQNTCKSTPLCCENVTQNGLINFGCTNLPLN